MASAAMRAGWLQELAPLAEARMGWSLVPSDERRVEHGLRNMARYKHFSGAAQCLEWLTGGEWTSEKADCCAYFLTVGETYFFREKRAFDLIVECARARSTSGTPLRVWSAGCCTGEEPYSAAIALLEAFPHLRPGDVSILATDVSKRNLDAAQAGLYRKWSFRGADARIRQRYFDDAGDGLLRIGGQVRAMVSFAELNLAQPAYPSPANGTAGIDVILCRNVLMYFSPVQRKLVVQRLRASLAEGGWLVVNASEASGELFEGFAATCHADAIHYRKTGNSVATVAPRPPAPALASGPPIAPARAATLRRVRPAAPAAATTAAVAPAAVVPDGDGIEELRARAASALAAGDIERARNCLQRIVFLQPLDVAAHYMMGIVLAQSGRQAQARRKFAVAAELLEGTADSACVPGTDGLPAGYVRASLRSLLDQGNAR